MKISLRNLGPLVEADFEVGDLTIICGCNNTGKTYATYATYGFFDFWNDGYDLPLNPEYVQTLMEKGKVEIDLSSHRNSFSKYLKDAGKRYSKMLHLVFAGNEKHFRDSEFSIEAVSPDGYMEREVDYAFDSPPLAPTPLRILKPAGSSVLTISLERAKMDSPFPLYLRHHLWNKFSAVIKDTLFGSVFPRPFISSAERTGSSIFQKELDFTRNRLVELLGDKAGKIQPAMLLGRFKGDYPIPVRQNVDFIRELFSVARNDSYILQNHSEMLDAFADIIGGEYKVSKEEVLYIPRSNKRVRLPLVEASSSVRAMLDVGFYLRHIAAPGDILMIDEPELNLHPENQRRLARLFASLVNIGIRVFVTTHSDYIIKELNTLIMLKQGKPHHRKIAKAEGYDERELILPDKIRVYIAQEAPVLRAEKKRKRSLPTLVRADIDPELGIEAISFDKTINEMNRIQESILFGGE